MLAHNLITDVPAYAFNATSSLWCSHAPALDLSSNRITHISADAFTNFNLTHSCSQLLDLSRNFIATIEPGTFSAKALGLGPGVDLSYNRLTVIGVGIFSGLSFENINLEHNAITTLESHAFANTTVFYSLLLGYNAISRIEEIVFFDMLCFGSLKLNDNNLTFIDFDTFGFLAEGVGRSQFSFLGALDLSNNAIALLDNAVPMAFQFMTLRGFDSNGILDLSRNRLTRLDAWVFYGLSVLTLNISNNQISSMADWLCTPLGDPYGWSSAFCGSDLDNLDLSHNFLTSIQANTFSGLKLNGQILLDHNNISVVEQGWSEPFPLVITLHMTSNPTQCLVTGQHLLGGHKSFVCDCAENLFGNGGFCDAVACNASTLPSGSDVAHGRITCPNGAASGNDCYLDCDSGFEPSPPFGSNTTAITCLGGVWGQLPNRAGIFPTCVPKGGFSIGEVIGFAFAGAGGALLLVGVVYLLVIYRRRLRAQMYDLELKEHLLTAKDSELDELRAAFTISPSDVRLEASIDGGSEGAFGQVWRAQWNDLTVAVKQMRAALLELDAKYLAEFEAKRR
nr:leucine-rich repeat protein [Nitrosomonas nitrosa]